MADKVEDQKKKAKNARERLDQSIFKAKAMLLSQQYHEAHDIAYQTMIKEKDAVGGEDSIHLLPGYFILVEALMAEGKIKKAEQYLTGAYWNFLKTQDDEKKDKGMDKADIKKQQLQKYQIELDKTFAKLFFKKETYQEAAKKLKNAILMDSKRLGPQHPRTALSYVLMGSIFEATAVDDSSYLKADSFYIKFIQIWYKFFRKEMKNSTGALDTTQATIMCTQSFINLQMICHNWQNKYKGELPKRIVLPMIQANFILVLLCHKFSRFRERTEFSEMTLQLLQKYMGKDHHKTIKIERELQMLFESKGDEEDLDDDEDMQ